jgi:seryl-tRNA synthetase
MHVGQYENGQFEEPSANSADVLEIAIPDDIPLNDEARKSVLETIYYVDARITKAIFVKNRIVMNVSHADAPSRSDFSEKVIRLCRKTSQSFVRVTSPVEFEHCGGGKCSDDPHEELLRTRQFIETGVGIAVYRGNLLRLMRGLDAVFRDFALRLGADEQEYPTTLPVQTLADSGYLEGFPQHAIFVTTARPDLEVIENLTDISKRPLVGDALMLPHGTLEHPRQLLAPTVCHHCFESLRGRVLEPHEPLLITALGRCHRHEYRTTRGLERLQTFTMRELIFCGTEGGVAARRDLITEFACETLAGLDLTLRLVNATDPFFATDAAGKRSFQSILGLKRELHLYLPYSCRWLAAGSVNNHRDTLVRRFGIRGADRSEPLFSSCVGFGYERMALGILAQFGVDSTNWPARLQRIIN